MEEGGRADALGCGGDAGRRGHSDVMQNAEAARWNMVTALRNGSV
jgi:hypothetical protein